MRLYLTRRIRIIKFSTPLAALLAGAFLVTPFNIQAGGGARAAERPAKQLFGAAVRPADLRPRSIGFYSKGCLSGGEAMPVNGHHWQAMRLSRNRNWGHQDLVAMLKWLAGEAARKDGWPGLLVGDMSQARGGPMLTGHASHQIGLDADVWLTPMPKRKLSRKEREDMSAVVVTKTGANVVFANVWTDAHFRLIKRAASHRAVQRILVAPGIKKKLCETERGNKSWLHKIRPYWGHNYHMHIRIKCPPGSTGCKAQKPPPRDDGCGAHLAWWFSDEPYAKPGKPTKPVKKKPPVKLSGLPGACRNVLLAPERPGTASALDAFAGRTPPARTVTAAALLAPALPVPLFPKPRPDIR